MFVAAHHPLGPAPAMILCAGAAALCAALPNAWLLVLPALLPVIDLAPWTGWLTFEEFDILVLAAAAGAWFRRAWHLQPEQASRPSLTMLGFTGLLLAAAAVAFLRGIEDAGGFQFGWFQGYEGSMNSLRLAKSSVEAALFAPLLAQAMSSRNPRGTALLAWGMTLGLALASLAAIWERVAFPGLLNFSSDYRTTALFWEMHVGGAAFDGFLALTVPFAVLALLRARGTAQILPAAAILTLGTYACLTTFSRGVYLAETASLAALAMAMPGRRSSGGGDALPPGKFIATRALLGALSVAAAIGLSFLVFRHGGYRALIAVLGCLTVLVLGGPIARGASSRNWGVAIVGGTFLAAAILAAGLLASKGAYWAFAVVFLLALASIAASRRPDRQPACGLLLATSLSLPVAAAQVAEHWGGPAALGDAVIALGVIAALAARNIRAVEPLWPTNLGRQSAALVGVLSLAGLTAVFVGGAYIGGRFATSEQDFAGRQDHWRAALELLRTPADWLLGKGLGRFPASFFFGAPGSEFPGRYQLGQEPGKTFLSLSGPHYQIGHGEKLRISQRVRLGPPGRYHVEFDGRAPRSASL
ncbi:MAG TPA: hypothetical protein VMB75_09715, partial [Rhodocyclaceae bacterium]|nr:hypothetical protein [Rhodocyclaceae bacterium]